MRDRAHRPVPVRPFHAHRRRCGSHACSGAICALPAAARAQKRGRDRQSSPARTSPISIGAPAAAAVAADGQANAAAQQLLRLLDTAAFDGLDRDRYMTRALVAGARRCVARRTARGAAGRAAAERGVRRLCPRPAHRAGRRDGVRRRSLRPSPPSPRSLLDQAAAAPSLTDYVADMRLDEPALRAAAPRACERQLRRRASAGCCRSTSSGRGRCPPAPAASSWSTPPRRSCSCTRTGGRWIRCGWCRQAQACDADDGGADPLRQPQPLLERAARPRRRADRAGRAQGGPPLPRRQRLPGAVELGGRRRRSSTRRPSTGRRSPTAASKCGCASCPAPAMRWGR